MVNFFDIFVFFLSSLDTCQSFMLITWLVLELRQFSFIKDWLEILKSEMPLSEFSPISRDRGELEILNLALMSLIKCYLLMLQHARVTACTVELLRKNQSLEHWLKFDQVLVQPMTNISNSFIALLWRLESDFHEMALKCDLLHFSRWWLLFLNDSMLTFKRVKNQKLIKIGFWLILAGW